MQSQKNKLDKLLKLWESRSNYLAPDTVQKMREPAASLQQYQQEQQAKFSTEIKAITQQTTSTFDSYQAQHQAFVCHAMAQIVELEQQKQTIELAPPPPVVQNPPPDTNGIPPSCNIPIEINQYSQPPGINPPNPGGDAFPPMNLNIPPPPVLTQAPPPNGGMDIPPFNQPPPGFFPPPPAAFPDFSKPPPGFPVPPKPEPEELIPSVPYYELPAGLIVPLIKVSIRLCYCRDFKV